MLGQGVDRSLTKEGQEEKVVIITHTGRNKGEERCTYSPYNYLIGY